MSLVALGENARLPDGIPNAWAVRWPAGPQPTGGEIQDNTLSYIVGDYAVTYGLMPAPIPWSEIEPRCENAVFWPDAVSQMRNHKKHAVITVYGEGEGNRVEQMTILTQATIAFTDASENAIGIIWFHSSHVISPARFAEIACEFIPDKPALPIWISISIMKNPDGSNQGFTRGLEAFDQLEFEATTSPEPPEELLKRLWGLVEYVIEKGRVIKDGDTIGEDANEKIKVTYTKSAFGAEGEVMRLDYQAGEASAKSMTTYGCIHAVGTLGCTIAFGFFLYAIFPFLRDSFFRHFLLIPMILIFGLVSLVVSDMFLKAIFGFEAFDTPKK